MRPNRILLGVLMIGVVVASAMAQAAVTGVADPGVIVRESRPQAPCGTNRSCSISSAIFWKRIIGSWPTGTSRKSTIQHDPNVASGLDPGPEVLWEPHAYSHPGPERLEAGKPKVSVTAEGDLVVVAFARENRDPRDPSKSYTTTWFDMWRIKDGKADEHWDPATIAAPSTALPAARSY